MWDIAVITLWLLGGSIMDIRRRRVPIWMLAAGGAIVMSALICKYENGVIDCSHILKGMLPGGLLLAAAFVTKKAGYGDGISMLYIGMLLGGGKALLVLGISLLMVSFFSVILLMMHKAGRNTIIPYLPFMTAGWLLAVIMCL